MNDIYNMIIVIRTKQGGKYWTDRYDEKDGFIVFKSTTKDDINRTVKLNKLEIVEISEIDKDFDNK